MTERNKSINNLTESDKIFLLNLARKTITNRDKKGILTVEEIKNLIDPLKENRGCFVTLTKKGMLRGCIGYILPIKPLYEAVIDNAYNAAFSDPRFPPVAEHEIKDIHIEISILTVPEKLEYKDKDDLLAKLKPNIDGVIIKKGYRSATFLPQVWEDLPNKIDFLSHLCMKAGLNPDSWKDKDIEIEIYRVELFEEER